MAINVILIFDDKDKNSVLLKKIVSEVINIRAVLNICKLIRNKLKLLGCCVAFMRSVIYFFVLFNFMCCCCIFAAEIMGVG